MKYHQIYLTKSEINMIGNGDVILRKYDKSNTIEIWQSPDHTSEQKDK